MPILNFKPEAELFSTGPLSLQYTEFTRDCLNESETNDFSSFDVLLALITRLQRIAEIAEFKMRSTTETLDTLKTTIDELKLQLDQLQPRIQACSHRMLYHISSSIPCPNYSPATTKLIAQYVTMQVNAIDLRSRSPHRLNPSTSTSTYTWRTTVLHDCFTSTQAYFQTFTSFPLLSYRCFTTTEWATLVKASTIMSLLCFDVPGIPGWDAAAARQQSHFGVYLESICYRMQQLLVQGTSEADGISSEGPSAAAHPNGFQMFKSVLEVVKNVYDELAGNATAEALERGAGAPLMPSSFAFSGGPSSCPVLSGAIRETEYWDMLQDSDFMDLLDDDILSAGFGKTNSDNLAG
jgi:hypothetical protein